MGRPEMVVNGTLRSLVLAADFSAGSATFFMVGS
jgi:hypothetical protein